MIIYFLLNIIAVFSFKGDKPRFCYDCKYFISNELGNEYGKCGAFPKINNDYTNYLITGKRDIEDNNEYYHYCGTARSSSDMCGLDGSLYRLKYTKK